MSQPGPLAFAIGVVAPRRGDASTRHHARRIKELKAQAAAEVVHSGRREATTEPRPADHETGKLLVHATAISLITGRAGLKQRAAKTPWGLR
jgi:acyl-coenzyme A thioesterase PaaI-like protein